MQFQSPLNDGYVTFFKPFTTSFVPGSFVCVMGPSGSGKSSFMNIISGQQPEGALIKGEVRLNGEPFTQKMRDKIVYMKQKNNLVHNLSVRESLYFAAKTRSRHPHIASSNEENGNLCCYCCCSACLTDCGDNQYKEAYINEQVNRILQALDLTEVADTIVPVEASENTLSGGQLRRVAMGLELVTSPPVLLLDEPTSGLDSYHTLKLVTLLRKICWNGYTTIIMTIHQPRWDTFIQFDELVLIAQGNVLFKGMLSDIKGFFGKSCGFMELEHCKSVSDFLIDFMFVKPNADGKALTEAKKHSHEFDNNNNNYRKNPEVENLIRIEDDDKKQNVTLLSVQENGVLNISLVLRISELFKKYQSSAIDKMFADAVAEGTIKVAQDRLEEETEMFKSDNLNCSDKNNNIHNIISSSMSDDLNEQNGKILVNIDEPSQSNRKLTNSTGLADDSTAAFSYSLSFFEQIKVLLWRSHIIYFSWDMLPTYIITNLFFMMTVLLIFGLKGEGDITGQMSTDPTNLNAFSSENIYALSTFLFGFLLHVGGVGSGKTTLFIRLHRNIVNDMRRKSYRIIPLMIAITLTDATVSLIPSCSSFILLVLIEPTVSNFCFAFLILELLGCIYNSIINSLAFTLKKRETITGALDFIFAIDSISSGFWVSKENLPLIFKWLSNVSPQRYTLASLLLNEARRNDEKMTSFSSDHREGKTWKLVESVFHFNLESEWEGVYYLVGLLAFCSLLSWIVMNFSLNKALKYF